MLVLLMRGSRWVRGLVLVPSSVVATFAGLQVWSDLADGPTPGSSVVVLAVAVALLVTAAAWPVRPDRRRPEPVDGRLSV